MGALRQTISRLFGREAPAGKSGGLRLASEYYAQAAQSVRNSKQRAIAASGGPTPGVKLPGSRGDWQTLVEDVVGELRSAK